MLGYPPEALNPPRIDTWQQFVHPDDRDRRKTALQHHVEGETSAYDCEFRLRHRAGHWVWVLDRGKVVEWDEAGRPQRMSGTFTDITARRLAAAEHQRVTDQMLHNSLYDTLTQLPNRALLIQQLDLALKLTRQPAQGLFQSHPQSLLQNQFAVLFLDLDHFKVINDSLGHLTGDEVLTLVAQKLRSLISPTDLVARLGGDEFVILLKEVNGLEQPVQAAERLLQSLQTPLMVGGRNVFLNASIGIVIGTCRYQTPLEALRDADIAMYQAKAQGRGRYVVFNKSMHQQAMQRLQLEQELRHAIENGELVLYYQPIFHLDTQQISGFEALVRWQHPDRGFIAPDSFIPIADGLVAIAEGVETQAQLHHLRHLGCELGQGYWFAKPLAAAAASDLLGSPVTAPSPALGFSYSGKKKSVDSSSSSAAI